jgi:uncharacterized protein YjbI with pentapeptide repeats
MGEAKFRHIGLPDSLRDNGKQKGISFEECDLNDTVFTECNLENAEIKKCKISGMTINGYSVEELINFYNKKPL